MTTPAPASPSALRNLAHAGVTALLIGTYLARHAAKLAVNRLAWLVVGALTARGRRGAQPEPITRTTTET